VAVEELALVVVALDEDRLARHEVGALRDAGARHPRIAHRALVEVRVDRARPRRKIRAPRDAEDLESLEVSEQGLDLSDLFGREGSVFEAVGLLAEALDLEALCVPGAFRLDHLPVPSAEELLAHRRRMRRERIDHLHLREREIADALAEDDPAALGPRRAAV